MNIIMPYGTETQAAEAPWGRPLATLDIADAPPLPDLPAAAREGFARPIGLRTPLAEIVRPGETVAIIVSDSFRHTAIDGVLPELLRVLNDRGVPDKDILFVVATGTHRGPTQEETAHILGAEVYKRFHDKVLTHDPQDEANLRYCGTTSRGTRVLLNRQVLTRDRVIVTGTVVLHYFGGFGGGRKSILPGIAGVETIAQNHARNLHATENRLDPAVRIGALAGNPVAEDMAEGAAFCRVDFSINTVLNRFGEIAGLFMGDLVEAHASAAEYARQLYAVEIGERADLVVASAGKAKNFIQSHKALFNAYQAVRPEGRIVFLTPSPEGYGGNRFRDWVRLGSRDAIIEELRKHAEINGQTALSTVEKAAITLFVTELASEEVDLLGGRKVSSLQAGLDLAREELLAQGITHPSVTLLPSASYSVPFLRSGTPAEGPSA
jgi:lactate racemase